jgi:hypothetical protein
LSHTGTWKITLAIPHACTGGITLAMSPLVPEE